MRDSNLDAQVNIDRLFHALGDPTRRALLDRLSKGPQSVSKLAAPLGITLTAVAQHLQILEECGLAHTEKVGRVRTCQIASAGFDALEQWIRAHRTLWEQRLDLLGELLAEENEAASANEAPNADRSAAATGSKR
ncbi:MAG TPA: metalloregulator ArsR/SmtB family transcription factor [Terracidiphilus sp.]|nr:metalloregulator ArsR/SmtB family transcription factor [Terracidiphilus sp.]